MNESDPRDPRLDAAYRDAATDEPPAAIDERIRATARRAVAAGPQSLEARARADAQRSWVARWRVPVSIAATVVIAVTLSYMVQDDEVRRAQIDGVPSGPAPAQESSAAPPPPAPVAPTVKAQETPASAAPPAPAKRAAPAADAAAVASRPEPVAVPFPASPPAERQAPAAGGASASADRARENAALAKELEQRQAELERRVAEEARTPAAQRLQSAPAPAAVPAPAPAPMAKPDPSRERALADRPAGRLEREAVSGRAEQKVRTPEEWLEDIRRLKTQGRTEDVAKELAEFRKRFPDYKLPADLLP
jgi:hypothetical protein